MYQVYIVDNEEFVVKSLMGSVDWAAYGFAVCGYATSGREAIEHLHTLHADVIFTDVQMPGMSGIELIKELQTQKHPALFIMLSGYAEFAYAQKALELGAIGYCLKPFDEENIGRYLKKAVKLIQKRSNIDAYDLAERLITSSDEEAFELLETRGFSLREGICIVSLLGDSTSCRSVLGHHLWFKTGVEQSYCVCHATKDGLDVLAEQLEKAMQASREQVYGVGIGEPIYEPVNIPDRFWKAENLSYGFFFGTQKILTYHSETAFVQGDKLMKRLENQIAQSKESVSTFVPELRRLAQKGCISMRHAFKLYNVLLSLSTADQSGDGYAYSLREITRKFQSFEQLLDYVDIACCQTKTMDKPEKGMTQKLLAYVNDHFCEDVTVAHLSELFFVNASYICQMMKKELGSTLTQYIVALRMEKARKLLLESNTDIAEISVQCGYKDYFYFIKIFKKYYASPPGSYRKAHLLG